MQGTGRPLWRRLIMPAIILLVGGGVAIWASQRERDRMGRMERHVEEFCAMAAAGEGLVDRLNTADGLLNGPISEALREACAGAAGQTGAISVTVAPGDGPEVRDGRATHAAVIRVDGVERLGLWLTVENDEILITGFWLPDAAPD